MTIMFVETRACRIEPLTAPLRRGSVGRYRHPEIQKIEDAFHHLPQYRCSIAHDDLPSVQQRRQFRRPTQWPTAI